ncbi:tetraacyldisaccharide 4'-kinase [Methylosoma difficile]
MKKTLSRLAQDIWYHDAFIGLCLMPLGFLFADIVRFRRFLYRMGVLKSRKLPVPVIIVGNITVGGTGKTPLVIWLANLLHQQGYKPGIVSRGYGRQADDEPVMVSADSLPAQVGDEALLIKRQTGCPVAVSPIRAAAADCLLKIGGCDIIIADDGLQHYALQRDIEIIVIDGERRFGNGYCLPAGPLREPPSRLLEADFVMVNGEKTEPEQFAMSLQGDIAINLATAEQKPLASFADSDCHAIAGIGNPARFFNLLGKAGLNCTTLSFPDHHPFLAQDLAFKDGKPVLMTEKDAVKCAAFATDLFWYVPVSAQPESGFAEQLLTRLREPHDR